MIYSATFQIIWLRLALCWITPLTLSQIAAVAAGPRIETGCSGLRGADMSKHLPMPQFFLDAHRAQHFARTCCTWTL